MMKEQKSGPKQLLTVQGKCFLNPYRTETERKQVCLVWICYTLHFPSLETVQRCMPVYEDFVLNVSESEEAWSRYRSRTASMCSSFHLYSSAFFFLQNKSFQLWCNLRSLRYNSSWCLPGLFPLHSLSWVTLVTFWMLGELGHLDLTRGGGGASSPSRGHAQACNWALCLSRPTALS